MTSVLVSSLRQVAAPAGRSFLGHACKLGSYRAMNKFSLTQQARSFSLFYTKTHEWMKIDGDVATIGISDYAQDELGEVVFADLPDEGKDFEEKDVIVTLESVKAVGEVYAPGPGEVIEVNTALNDEPSLVNQKAMTDGWLVKVKYTGSTDGMMDQAAYDAHVKAEKDAH
eukprot:gnl/MRDRNA2_/MRDRNA2_46528_c0_seq1.p1 gnl/MRDRNA2_/MRDRNA2_46528_c0~~gnl/MRDRNA2_/MRDRNA2_46528_c0_seq1.p1  ORF type:complete len:170 (-),score=39.01 gnl/MRDRNA2_/MRDRNA2_46528_c0_seq1:78-587(-)